MATFGEAGSATTNGKPYENMIAANLLTGVNPELNATQSYVQSITGYVPATNDYAGILAAFNAAVAAGGGKVKILPITYNIGGNTLPLGSNVFYEGSGYTLTYGDIPDGGSAAFASGSLIQGDGTANIFAFNATDRASPYGTQALFSNAGATDCGIKGLAIRNGLRGIKAGAFQNPSFWYSNFEDIWIEDCSINGAYFENFLHCTFKNIRSARCGSTSYVDLNGNEMSGGQVYAVSGSTLLGAGNSWFESNYNAISPTNNIKQRKMRFVARNASGFGSINGFFPQSNSFNQVTSAQTVTPAGSSSANLGVTDGTKFQVDMPVVFSQSFNGLPTAGTILFVTSVVSNNIQVSNTLGGVAYTSTATGAQGTVTTYGYPCIEFTGYDTSTIVSAEMRGMDCEAGGTTKILFQNTHGAFSANGMNNDSASSVEITGRNSAINFSNSDLQIRTDWDTSSLLFSGALKSFIGYPPQGFYAASGGEALNFYISGNMDFQRKDTGYGNALRQDPACVVYQPPVTFTNAAASPLNLVANSQAITFIGSANGGIALLGSGGAARAIGANSVGVVFDISNPTAFTLAVTSFAGQTFNNKGAGFTVATMPANSCMKIRADVISGTYFWSVLSFYAQTGSISYA